MVSRGEAGRNYALKPQTAKLNQRALDFLECDKFFTSDSLILLYF
jgi:hypothetical protein